MATETFKANGATQDFKNKVQGAESALDRISHDAGEKIGSMASQFSDSASEYVQTGRRYVKENPLQSLAIAAAVGAAVGGLVSISMRRRT
ncbi:MAG: glycine zipper domain-containing protein [Pseudobdellovibrio sp.]